MSKSKQPFRDGKIHVCETMCSTCIFRPGNLMHLEEGKVDEMIARCKKNESAIHCHKTLDSEKSICRGFFNKHATLPLVLAEKMNLLVFTKVD